MDPAAGAECGGHHGAGRGPAAWPRPSGGPARGTEAPQGARWWLLLLRRQNRPLPLAERVSPRAGGAWAAGRCSAFWRREGERCGAEALGASPGWSRGHHRPHGLPHTICERGRLLCDGPSGPPGLTTSCNLRFCSWEPRGCQLLELQTGASLRRVSLAVEGSSACSGRRRPCAL